MAPELPELVVPDAVAWRAWLEANHDTADGVWLALTKKGGTTTTLTYEQAVLESLCFGWIDGQARSRDAGTSFQRMTPRRARSRWSALNVKRVGQLEAEGRMTEAGRAQVRAAQADGRWDAAYEGPATIAVPPDLLEALAAEPRAQAWWDVLTSANRFAILLRIDSVKRAETRERKIREFVAALADGRTPYPQKRRPDGA
ncbi:YdeI/OmpD-associated family protein [Actinotalea ferrariae]|uniref:YdeI/OmpD-associated family protein n=1 Tax=Actinotalea ferrariae TaxID=1386098 RepID=UPI001C8CCD73|nr:YdeI/OmpD-associated family protein [Actinotalea ferrariae]MBX9243716.1 YdeI/OmpD-associated family protein [Actinotalea ferrariae]